jgi:hypothetical protein
MAARFEWGGKDWPPSLVGQPADRWQVILPEPERAEGESDDRYNWRYERWQQTFQALVELIWAYDEDLRDGGPP